MRLGAHSKGPGFSYGKSRSVIRSLKRFEITILCYKPRAATLSAKRRDLGIEDKVAGCVGLADRLHQERWIIGTGVKHDHARRGEQP